MRQELERVTPESVGISSQTICSFIEELEKSGTEMHGLMIARFGKVAAECWWKPYTKDTPHVCHSLGKTYTGTSVGMACTEGILNLDEKLVDIFADEFRELDFEPDDNFKQITVHHVLSMGNGMAQQPDAGENWFRNFLTHKVDYKPGTHFLYNSMGSCMLSAIVQKRCGEGIREYLTPRVFEKIGMDTGALKWLKFHDGHYAEPGVFSTTENNLRLAMLYMNKGKWNGETILSEEWVERAVSKQIDTTEDGGIQECKYGYGYQLWMCRIPGVYRFDGGHGQYCIISPKDQLIIAINEGAAYPTYVQKTLDIVFRYFFGKELESRIEENEEAWNRLLEIEHSREIPKIKTKPVQEGAAKINGTYTVTEGDPNVWLELHPDSKAPNFFEDFYENRNSKVSKISFQMENGYCLLQYDDDVVFHVRMDNEYRVERVNNRVMPPLDLTVSNGYFLDENTFVVQMRWLNTCFVTKSVFEFHGDEVNIDVVKYTLQERMPFITNKAHAKKE